MVVLCRSGTIELCCFPHERRGSCEDEKVTPILRGGSVNLPWHPALLSSPSTGNRQQAGLFMPWLPLIKHSLCVLISYIWRRNRFRERHTVCIITSHRDLLESSFLHYQASPMFACFSLVSEMHLHKDSSAKEGDGGEEKEEEKRLNGLFLPASVHLSCHPNEPFVWGE